MTRFLSALKDGVSALNHLMNALAVLLRREADREEVAPSVRMAPTLDEAIRTLLYAAQQEEFGTNDDLDAATSRINEALEPGARFTTENRNDRSG